MMDLYAIPSHNHQAYYAVVCKVDDSYELIYARTEIYTYQFSVPIRMYSFSDAVKAQQHTAADGRIIVRLKKINPVDMKSMSDIADCIPKGCFFQDNIIIIDGVFQAIRIYEHNTVVKECVFRDSHSFPIPEEEKLYITSNRTNISFRRKTDIQCKLNRY